MTTIDDLVNPRIATTELTGESRRAAIEQLAGLLADDGRVDDVDTYVEAVLAREDETGGTGMESGVAIPHAKSPAVSAASVAVGRTADGVDFGAEDGTPSDLVFLIAAPEGEDDLHVTVLSRLARRLIHESFRSSLREADTAEELVQIITEEVEL